MLKSLGLFSGLTATACILLSPSVMAQAVDQKLGKVHFETSCAPEAAAAFDQGMLYQHSFWYRASQREFNKALKADPGCGIAYWGIALSLLWNPHTAPPAKNLAEGAAALAKGKEVGAKTERERDYITALSAMYADYDKVDHRTRVLNYMQAMEQLAAKYPDDDEAQIDYAISLNVGASPTDKTYANQLKGAAILEKIWERQPDHPGIAHYLIHLYDTPALAEKGLDGGAALCESGARRAACAAYAVAYFHPRRLLAGVDRFEHGRRALRQGEQGSRRSTACDGLRGLCLSATWDRTLGRRR